MLWLGMAVMTIAAVAAIIVPLVRRRPSPARRALFDQAVYRDQLAELERDLARGVLTEDQAAAARLEVERRLLAAAAADMAEPMREQRVDGITTILLAAAVSAGAVALYLGVGAPGVADQPFAEHATENAQVATTAPHDLAKSADTLAAKLRENPNDADGWMLLARTQAELQRWQDAAQSYRHAMSLTGNRPDAVAGYGEMLVLSAQGIVTPSAKQAFDQAIAGDPTNLAARYYLALADAQAGKPERAVEAWSKLEAEAPAGAPWLPNLRERIAETAKAAGIPVPEPSKRLAHASDDMPNGPTEADIAAAAKMTPEQRQSMIRGMVDGLAARLEKNPNDPAGWRRLANAYRVLGETGNSKAALARAAQAEAGSAPAASAGKAPPGPTQADMEAAASMTPEQRRSMIRGMVERLAARLEKNPDDPAGWQRLAHAYEVLGETDKAKAAFARAGQAKPGSAPAANAGDAPPGPTQADMEAAATMTPEQRQSMIRGMVDGLAARLEKNPDDPAGWVRLGRAYRVLGEKAKAENALGRAAALEPKNETVLLEHARAILEADGAAAMPPNKLPDSFVARMKEVLALDPKQPEALWYLGLSAAQRHDAGQAKGYWTRLLTELSPSSEDYKTVRAAVDALK
jgi:cytochrome c-type biogenesis protein CcmH